MSFDVRTLARAAFVAALMAATACHGDATGPGNSLVAGSYALASVSGRGPASGSLVLSPTGVAERRVRFTQVSGSAEYVARGTYQVRPGGIIELALREDDGRSTYVWRPTAVFVDGRVELRYPDPADGPDIVERYQPVMVMLDLRGAP
jgi:hypothetical protein